MRERSASTITTRHLGVPGEQTIALSLALDKATRGHAEAERTLREVRSRIAARVLRLRARARKVGFAAGRRASAADIDTLFDQVTQYTDTVLAARSDCLALSVAIAAEIVEADLVPNSDLLARRIERAIGELLDARAPRIRAAPMEVESLRGALSGLPAEAIVPDPAIARGDAIVETAAGRLRLMWREHLQRIHERLIERIRGLRGADSVDERYHVA